MAYTFSNAHGIFYRIDHMLVHRLSLSRLKKTDVTQSIFSDHNEMKLEIKKRRKTGNFTKL